MTTHQGVVNLALRRLRAAADLAEQGWVPTDWRKVSGPGPDHLEMRPTGMRLTPAGGFEGLELRPGSDLTVAARITVPERVASVPTAGEPLLATLDCIYPLHLVVGEETLLADELPVVASGPAQVRLVEAIDPAEEIDLALRVRTPPNQVRDDWLLVHFTTPALQARFHLLDIAWAQLLLASRMAVGEEQAKAVEAAAALVPEVLEGSDSSAIAADLDAMADALSPLAGRVAELKVHAIGHTHIDLAWCWTWEDTKEVIKRDVRSVLDLMERYPEMRFTHSQPAGYEVLRREEPELFAAVCDRIAEGRWEPATAQWVEADANIPSGEAHARQLLEGVSYSRRHLGASPTALLAPDTFGHAGNLPQLAASAGVRVYYHHRANPGQVAGGPLWPAYWWRGDDGTRLLAVSSPVYLGPITAGRVARDALALTYDRGLPACLYFYGVGDHGGGPAAESLDALRLIQGSPGLPTLRCSTLQAFADDVINSGAPLPEHAGESPTVFEGCYTTHADIKRYNRSSESALIAAESLATVAGLDRTSELAKGWQQALFHQFHDIICGSAIHEVYEHSAAEAREVAALAGRVTRGALDALEAGLPTDALAVTNPLGFERTEVVHVPGLSGSGSVAVVGPDGTRSVGQLSPDGLRFVATLPAFATLGYRMEEFPDAPGAISVGEQSGSTHAGGRFVTVETPYFFAMVRKDCGVVTTLYDKGSGRELVGYNRARGVACEQVRPDLALGVLQVIDEYPHGMSAWVVDEVYSEESLIRGAEFEVVEVGPVRVVLQARQRFRSSSATKSIVFYADLARVDFQLDIDWQEAGSPDAGVPGLALAFGTRLSRTSAWYETPFGAASRPADGLVVPGLRWADIGSGDHGVAVLNDGKYGFDALGSRLRVHVVRSAYDPDAVSDFGWRDRSRFSVVPHQGSWADAGIPLRAASFDLPFEGRVVPGPEADRPLVAGAWRPHILAPSTVAIAALKFAHDGSGARVLRLYETSGRRCAARLRGLGAASRVHDATVVEDRRRSLDVREGSVELSFRPYEVRTLIVDPSLTSEDRGNLECLGDMRQAERVVLA